MCSTPARSLGGDVSLRGCLKDGGTVVASIPNIAHYKIIKKLLFIEWRYEPGGILDHTHLRFFTRASIEDLFRNAGFEILRIEREGRERWWSRLFGPLSQRVRDFTAVQFTSRRASSPPAPLTDVRPCITHSPSRAPSSARGESRPCIPSRRSRRRESTSRLRTCLLPEIPFAAYSVAMPGKVRLLTGVAQPAVAFARMHSNRFFAARLAKHIDPGGTGAVMPGT